MDRHRRNFLGNLTAGFLGYFGAASFICFFWLVTAWTNAAPRSPDALQGLIYEHNNHGTVVYFSAFQTTACTLLLALWPLLLFTAVAIAPKKNPKMLRSRFGFSMRWDEDDPFRVGPWAGLAGAAAALPAVFLFGPMIVRTLNAAGVILPFG